MRFLLWILFLFFSKNVFTQVHRCHAEDYASLILKDADRIHTYQNRIAHVEQTLTNTASSRSEEEPFIIPVAIHFQGLKDFDPDCLTILSNRQIEILNQHFKGSHQDTQQWTHDAPLFPHAELGRTNITFVLATKNHPQGYQLSDEEPAITFNQVRGNFSDDWKNYLNIFVRQSDYLGLSPYGGTGDGDGIFISLDAFGSGEGCGEVEPLAPFELGKTLVHEVGHYFFLQHIWGERGCEHDDGVFDTPISSGPHYDCPDGYIRKCTVINMHFNFMDYVDDACMYMFTEGQARRMERYIKHNLSNLTENAQRVCELKPIQAGCDRPANLQTIPEDDGTITLQWDSVEEATHYQLQYKATENKHWKSLLLLKNQYNIETATYGKSYEWRVRIQCGNSLSEWSEKQVITGEQSTPTTLRERNFFLAAHPNPFNEQLTISGKYSDHLDDIFVNVYVYNYRGELVKFQYEKLAYGYNYFEVLIDTSDLGNGFYFVLCEYGEVKKVTKVFRSDTW